MPKQKNRPRNLVAQAAIMRKGGAHQKSASSKRRKQKNKLRKELDQLAQ